MHRILLALALLMPVACAEPAVHAPAFTLDGSYTLWITGDSPIHSIEANLDTGQRVSLIDLNQSVVVVVLMEVPDGVRTWNLQVTTGNESQTFRGEFTAQNVTRILAQASNNATQKILDALQANSERLEAIQLPSDLARQGDFAGLAKGDDVALLFVRFDEQERQQARDTQATTQSIDRLESGGNHLALLVLLGVALVVLYLHRVRSELRLNPEDRAVLRAVAWRLQITPESQEFKAALHQLGYQPSFRPHHKAVKPRA